MDDFDEWLAEVINIAQAYDSTMCLWSDFSGSAWIGYYEDEMAPEEAFYYHWEE